MAIRRKAFEGVGEFRSGFGKVGVRSRPEDTYLCIHVGASAPDAHWVYAPTAVVDHDVPPARATFAFFLRRCYAEGAGKIELSADLGAEQDLGDERAFLVETLPRGGRASFGPGNLRGHWLSWPARLPRGLGPRLISFAPL